MDIGEVAKQTGLTPATLRYYEQIGLIESTGRHGLRRIFANSVIQKLQLILLLKNNHFSLAEIKAMIDRDAIDRAYLRQKTQELQAKVTELTAVCNTLQHIANCPQTNHFDCASFQKLLNNHGVSI